GPVVDDAAQSFDDQESVMRMIPEVVEGHGLLLREVRNLPHRKIFLQLRRAIGRIPTVTGRRRRSVVVGRIAKVVGVELEPNVVADGHDDAEGAVIADGPRSEHSEEGDQCERATQYPTLARLVRLPKSKAKEKRQRGHDGGIGVRGKSVEGAKADPREWPGGLVNALCDAETRGEKQAGQRILPKAPTREI